VGARAGSVRDRSNGLIAGNTTVSLAATDPSDPSVGAGRRSSVVDLGAAGGTIDAGQLAIRAISPLGGSRSALRGKSREEKGERSALAAFDENQRASWASIVP